MKKILTSKNHQFINHLNVQSPDVVDSINSAVKELYVKENACDNAYIPMFKDWDTVVGIVKTLNLEHILEKPKWGPDHSFKKSVNESSPIDIIFGENGNVFMSKLEHVESLDRSSMKATLVDKVNGTLITMKEWVEHCKEGWFIDYDGFAKYSDGIFEYEKFICPSMIEEDRIDMTFSHVIWYNR